jgi:hypothetical protein
MCLRNILPCDKYVIIRVHGRNAYRPSCKVVVNISDQNGSATVSKNSLVSTCVEILPAVYELVHAYGKTGGLTIISSIIDVKFSRR